MKNTPGLIVLLCLLCLEGMAQTDSVSASGKKYLAPWFVDRFAFSAGTFVPISNTNIQVNAVGKTAGTDIDFENDLGFNPSVVTVLADLQYRVKRRSRFNLSYFRFIRSTDYTLKKDIVFDGDTYPVNAAISSSFNATIWRFSYGYALIENSKYELGLLIGTHIISSTVSIAVNGSTTSVNYNNKYGFTAPLPDLGIWGGYTFSKRAAITGEIDYLGAKIGDINGRILGGSFSFLYRITKKFDLALGYNGLNIKVDVDKPKVDASFRWGYNGPSLTAKYSFGKKYWH